jgi:hypothetical protein
MPALPLRVSHFVSSECKLTECKLRRPRRRPVAGRHAAMQQQGRRRPWLWLYHISSQAALRAAAGRSARGRRSARGCGARDGSPPEEHS